MPVSSPCIDQPGTRPIMGKACPEYERHLPQSLQAKEDCYSYQSIAFTGKNLFPTYGPDY